jgi:chitin disaccharide deacetylase
VTHPLVISADDYAYHQAVDDGILELIRQGRLTATSCMVMSPRWPEAAKALTLDIRQKADIGLHLDFTEFGAPVRQPLSRLILRTFLHSLSAHAIRQNIQAQLDRIEEALGTSPDYIDGHQHVHQLPQIRQALLEIIQQRYGQHGPWLRISNPPSADGLKGHIIRALGAQALQRDATQQGLHCSSRLLGVYDFNDTAMPYLDRLRICLQQAQDAGGMPVLMCHPALPDGKAPASDPIAHARGAEFSALGGADFAALLRQFAISPLRGSAYLST